MFNVEIVIQETFDGELLATQGMDVFVASLLNCRGNANTWLTASRVDAEGLLSGSFTVEMTSRYKTDEGLKDIVVTTMFDFEKGAREADQLIVPTSHLKMKGFDVRSELLEPAWDYENPLF